MLNELKQIANSVATVADTNIHPWIRPSLPKRGDALLVDIDHDGAVCNVIAPTDEIWDRFRYCSKNNFSNFPLINLKPGLDEKVHGGNVKKFNQMLDLLRDTLRGHSKSPDNWLAFLGALEKIDPDEFIDDIVQRFLNGLDPKRQVPKRFQMVVRTTCCEDDLMSNESWSAINKVLLSKLETSTGEDAFGMPGQLISTFNTVDLPKIGKFYPYSRNKDSKCYMRYGMKAAECFPMSESLQLQICNSLRWITAEERKGMTWNSHAVKKGKKRVGDVLTIVMVEGDEEVHDLCRGINADVFLRDRIDDMVAESTPVIEAINGLLEDPDEITGETIIASFYIPTNGASTVLYFKRAASSEIIQRVAEWSNYCDFSLSRTHWVVNKLWNKSAGLSPEGKIDDANKLVHRFVQIHELYAMVLDGDQRIANRIIDAMSKSHINLMIDAANRIHIDPNKKYTEAATLFKVRGDYFRILRLVEYLLRNRERGTAFDFGKLCKLSTKMYRHYRMQNKNNVKAALTPGLEAVNASYGNARTAYMRLLKRMLQSYIKLTCLSHSSEDSLDDSAVKVYWKWRRSMIDPEDIPVVFSSAAKLELALGFIKG